MKNINPFILVLFTVLTFATQLTYAKQVTLGIGSSAGYPFVCHRGYVDSPLGRQFLEGKLLRLYFGYTRLTTEQYLKTSNPDWYNFRGEPVAEGYVDLHYTHDGGYKGTYNLDPVKLEVPEGWNLLYRIAFLKIVGGSCYSSSDALRTAYEESPVYFLEINQ